MTNETFEFLSEWFVYDIESPSCLKWRKQRSHSKSKAGDYITSICGAYYQVSLNRRPYKCHRVVLILHGLYPQPRQVADHVNRNTLDNRIENLRWVSLSQNNSNRVVLSSAGFKYVRHTPSGRFRAQYRCLLRKRTITCGTYDTPHEAHIAAIAHKLEHCWNP